MIKAKQFILILGDIILLYAALFLTIYVRYGHITPELLDVHVVPFSIIFIIWLGLFYAAGWYDIRAVRNKLILLETTGATIIIGLILAIIIFYAIPYFSISPKTNLAIFSAFFFVLAFLWRIMIGVVIKTPKQRVLLIGSSDNALELKKHLNENPQLGYKVQHHIENPTPKELNNLGNFIASDHIGIVIVLEAEQNKNYVASSLYKNLGTGIEIIPFADFYETILGRVPLGELREEWFFENVARSHRGYNTLKRGIDIISACFVGLIFIALWPILYILIKTTSRGPFILKQTRVGKNGRTFTHYKIRTMYERNDGNHWLDKDSQYITPIGRFLRATHIDELPQMWNILNGDLSLTGPRPDLVDFFRKLEEQIPYYAVRTLVKPGLTGWAQTNYPVTASLEETKVRLSYDLFYLKHYSLSLDVLIALKTLKTIFTAAGK